MTIGKFNRAESAQQPSIARLLLRSQMLSRGQSQSGLSLIEALVAIILVTIVVSVITPPIFLAVATRVNNRRTEQAMQLAQAEIERVRLLMTSTGSQAEIAPFLPDALNIEPDAIVSVAAPTTLCTVNPPVPPCAANQLASAEPGLAPDQQRFYIQSFRDTGAVTDNGDVLAFRMGVRVYSADVAENLGNLDIETKPLFTSGTGYRGTSPLMVMYTELNRGGSTLDPEFLNELSDYTSR